MTDPVRPWAERYLKALGDGPSDRKLAAQRARVLLAYSSQKSARWTGVRWALSASAALAFVALLLLFRGEGVERIRPDRAPLKVGQVVKTEGEARKVEFVGGSRVVLQPESRGTLSRYSSELVELTLHDGEVQFDVAQKAGRRWLVRAADFRIYVIGTAFTVSTNPRTRAFSVQVSRGEVSVQGPGLQDAVSLKAGESFHFHPDPEKTDASTSAGSDQEAEKLAPTATTRPAAEKPPLASDAGLRDWKDLASSGKYAEALSVVERRGVSSVLSHVSPGDMILLGNTGRFSGNWNVARQAYQAARSSGDAGVAALAAYYLARVALDGQGSSDEAIKWLRTYLKEAPMGELSASARARLMDLLDKNGDRAGARRIAAEYVSLHPDGPQVDQARRLGKSGP